jgi:hypothetical protein
LIRIAFCEGRRLCLALILDRVDRFPALAVDLAEAADFLVPVAEGLVVADLAGALEGASED